MAYTLACLLRQTESSLARRLLGIYVGSHTFAWSLTSKTAPAHARTRRHATLSTLPTLRHFASMAQEDFAPEQQTLLQLLQPYQQQKQQPEQSQQPLLQRTLNTSPASAQRPSTGFKKTFYKRKLPCPPAIEFSSPEGRQLFQEALLAGHMVGFFKLMEQFNTQDEPAFCGLASLAMVLNALSIDPRRTWKGSWRWFHEAMLDCCRPLDVVKAEGITLFQASCLARCNGARVELRPYGSTSLEQFRSEVAAVCRSGEEHVVVSYSRKPFLQTGDGHFSPIGGYHPDRDLVLVLDVARFKYPPHWVPLPLLYSAMSYIDPETGRPRGYMRLASNPLLDSVLLTLDVRSDGWRPADAFVRQGAPELVQALAAQGGLSGEDVVRRVVDAMPLDALDAFLVVRSGAPLAGAAASGSGSGTTTGSGGGSGTAAAPAGTELPPAAAAGADACTDGGSSSSNSFLRAAGPVCGTPESIAAAVRHASEVGNAAAAAVAAAAAAAGSSSFSPAWSDASTQPGPGPSGRASSGALDPVPDLRLVPPRRKHCGGGKTCGSSSCSTSHGGATPGGAAGVADVSGSSCNSSSSSVIAAATAVFTAQDRCIPLAQRQQLLDELHGMPLFTLVASHLAARKAESNKESTAIDSGASAGPSTAPSCSTLPPRPHASSASHPVTLQMPPQPLPPAPQPHNAAPPTAQQPPSPPTPDRYLAEKVVMALLMQRPDVWPSEGEWRDPAGGAQWRALLGTGGYSVVEAEAAYLSEQLVHVDEVLQSGDFDGTCGEHSSRLDCAAHGH